MQLTPHDEFLHLGYPRDKAHPWKENYYFNYIDRDADAMGIFHASIQRHKGIASIKAISVIGGKPLTYAVDIPWPPIGDEVQNESVIITDGKLTFEIIEPYKKQRVTFEDGDTHIAFEYTDRFREYLYEHESYTESQGDKALDVTHYEQGMHVNGQIKFDGKVRNISCLGHRDHTWGFRDEQGLRGWNWIAVQTESFTMNFSKVRRKGLPDSEDGFISYADRAEAVKAVEIIDIEKNEDDDPIVCKYRVTLKSGTQLNIIATRFLRMFLPGKKGVPVVHHENFSEFLIEETGETGVGIDEHMVIL